MISEQALTHRENGKLPQDHFEVATSVILSERQEKAYNFLFNLKKKGRPFVSGTIGQDHVSITRLYNNKKESLGMVVNIEPQNNFPKERLFFGPDKFIVSIRTAGKEDNASNSDLTEDIHFSNLPYDDRRAF